MPRNSARYIELNEPLRAAIVEAMDRQGLGVTSPEISASTNTVRKVLDPGGGPVNIGTLAKMVISLGIAPEEVQALDCPALAAEMRRRTEPNPYNEALLQTMNREDVR